MHSAPLWRKKMLWDAPTGGMGMDYVETWQVLNLTVGASFAVVAALVIAACAWFFRYEAKRRWAIIGRMRRRAS